MLSRYLIYTLSDPRDDSVRYVGQSTHGLKRPRSHTQASKLEGDYLVSRWVKCLLKIDLKPVIEVVEEFDSPEPLNEAEQFWISQFRALGFRLTNLTDGGTSNWGWKASSETRAKMRASALRVDHHWTFGNTNKRGKKVSLEGKKRMCLSKGGRAIVDSDGRIFYSQNDAAAANGVSRNNVRQILKGKCTHASGCSFRYLEERN